MTKPRIDLHRLAFSIAAVLTFIGQTSDADGVPRWARIACAAVALGIATFANRDAIPVVGPMLKKGEEKAEAPQ